jgi:hypothetical protein
VLFGRSIDRATHSHHRVLTKLDMHPAHPTVRPHKAPHTHCYDERTRSPRGLQAKRLNTSARLVGLVVFALGIATNVVPGMVTYYNEMESADMECQTGVGLWLITYNFQHNWDAGCKTDHAYPMYCRMDSADVTLNNCPISSANYDTPCCAALASKCRAGKGFGVLGQ